MSGAKLWRRWLRVDDRRWTIAGRLLPPNPKVFRLDFGRGKRERGPGVPASGQKFIEEVGKILDALFLHQAHDALHKLESGAANMLSAKGTTRSWS